MTYNPLDLENLADQLRRTLEEQPPCRLDKVPLFEGAGVYCLYYRGPFALYKGLARVNRSQLNLPIYVGKAVTEAARKGGGVAMDIPAPLLHSRIQKHASSIMAAVSTLSVTDFAVRWLATLPVWVPLGEAALIARYRPLWNVVIDGFGNNDPGARRRNQYRSVWDHLHPGRAWAALQASNPGFSESTIGAKVAAHLR